MFSLMKGLHFRDVRYTDIPKIPVLKLISIYRYDFFSHTDIPKFPLYRKTSVYRYCRNSSVYRCYINNSIVSLALKRV